MSSRRWINPRTGFLQLVWLLVYREGPITSAALKARLSSEADRIETALEQLSEAGRVTLSGGKYSTREVVVTQREPSGWEAAMLDHFQAVVKTLCARLSGRGAPDENGGSTYSFYQVLGRLRKELSELRDLVEKHNAAHPEEPTPDMVTVYFGQFVRAEEEG